MYKVIVPLKNRTLVRRACFNSIRSFHYLNTPRTRQYAQFDKATAEMVAAYWRNTAQYRQLIIDTDRVEIVPIR